MTCLKMRMCTKSCRKPKKCKQSPSGCDGSSGSARFHLRSKSKLDSPSVTVSSLGSTGSVVAEAALAVPIVTARGIVWQFPGEPACFQRRGSRVGTSDDGGDVEDADQDEGDEEQLGAHGGEHAGQARARSSLNSERTLRAVASVGDEKQRTGMSGCRV